MFVIILFFITSALGFLTTFLIVRKSNYLESPMVNIFLVFIALYNSIRFFFYGLAHAFPEMDISSYVDVIDSINFMLIPCFYIYFKNIINESKFELKNLLHFIIPILLGISFYILYCCTNENTDLIKTTFLLFVFLINVIYVIFTFILLFKHLWKRKSYINSIQEHNKVILNWCLFLFISLLFIFLTRLSIILISYFTDNSGMQYFWVIAIIWLVVFFKIIITPEIQYGYNMIHKTSVVKTDSFILKGIWNLETNINIIKTVNEKKLYKKIKPFLSKTIMGIESYSMNSHAFRNPNVTIEHISIALKLPTSHIYFIMKYHCKESFSDYKKIVRITDAMNLIKAGYLNNNKVEMLSALVGFSSYNTFSIAFKNITGVTTQEYLKRY
ncbi:MAG: helix-turn-helix domain-containing protein [Flavobacterium psychrophilum]